MNVYLSKTERVYYFESVKFIHIIMRGRKRYDLDERKYFIRFTFENQDLEWGETFYLTKIEEKVNL
jgi:hypothetical protein